MGLILNYFTISGIRLVSRDTLTIEIRKYFLATITADIYGIYILIHIKYIEYIIDYKIKSTNCQNKLRKQN